MKLRANQLLRILWLALFCATLSTRAATLWSGPATNFVNIAGSDPTQAVDQDRLTPNVWITRDTNHGIYNAAIETAFAHFWSPQGTEWSDGLLSDYASLTFVDWDTWAKLQHGGPFGTIGVSAVVHLTAEDVYLSVTFNSWGGPGGGFSYTRSTAPGVNQAPTVAITSPADGATFTPPAVVSITASASDSDGSVTNIQFFDGTTLVGQTNDAPYTVTANLAVGGHALTAVAMDNGGLSRTSSVVNVTVIGGNPPPSLMIQLTGDTVEISWPDAGGRLQSKTNILSPTWVDVPNSTTTNHVVLAIDPDGSEGVFYRLALP